MDSVSEVNPSPVHSASDLSPLLAAFFLSWASFCSCTRCVCEVKKGRDLPRNSSMDLKSCLTMNSCTSAHRFCTKGYPWIITPVHTCTVSQPRSRNSAASMPVSTPPMPERDFLPSYFSLIMVASDMTLASAIGLTALEEYPPGVLYPSTQGSGLSESRLMPMTDWMVLMAARPSRPASSATLPGLVMSVMFGVILAHTGMFAASFTQPHTSSSRSQSWPMAAPMRRSGMPWGQEKLSSKMSTPHSSQRPISSSHAFLLYSSMMLAMRTRSGYSSLRRLNSSIIFSKGLSLTSSMFSHPMTSLELDLDFMRA
mmetsp:Transcript_34967/g.75708  ORF Transcript_34967/g.75708 Transcript_34967/m.75708 type:complete len:312 (+) Transcript_34967:76-1011(+)